MLQVEKESAEEEEQNKKGKKTEVDNGTKVQGVISKSELAQEIFPNMSPGSALNALRRATSNDMEMHKELEKTSYNPYCHVLTHQQASIIRKHIYGSKGKEE